MVTGLHSFTFRMMDRAVSRASSRSAPVMDTATILKVSRVEDSVSGVSSSSSSWATIRSRISAQEVSTSRLEAVEDISL